MKGHTEQQRINQVTMSSLLQPGMPYTAMQVVPMQRSQVKDSSRGQPGLHFSYEVLCLLTGPATRKKYFL
jgi:hypothetical protein